MFTWGLNPVAGAGLRGNMNTATSYQELPVYARSGVEFVAGEGVELIATDGRR